MKKSTHEHLIIQKHSENHPGQTVVVGLAIEFDDNKDTQSDL